MKVCQTIDMFNCPLRSSWCRCDLIYVSRVIHSARVLAIVIPV